jgi:tRNA wybutosine-synthesizing protein 2
MGFKELLREKLEGNVNCNLDKLPKGFQRIGDIIILNLDKEFDDCKKEIGEAVLELFKVRSVCNKFGEITGKFREPQIEVLAGDEDTIVTHVEHGIRYRFDLRKVMFAKGNLSERVRYPKQLRDGEVIVDMFAGLGYFSLAMGKLSNPEKIYSIELNPVSFGFLEENIKINHINCIEAINGDNREIIDSLVKKGVKVDRVLMGYLPPPKEFLPWALKIVKKGGIVHYEDILTVGKIEEESRKVVEMINEVAKQFDKKVQLIHLQDVKSYGPMTHHYVFDLIVK